MSHILPVKVMCLHDFWVRPVNFVRDIKKVIKQEEISNLYQLATFTTLCKYWFYKMLLTCVEKIQAGIKKFSVLLPNFLKWNISF